MEQEMVRLLLRQAKIAKIKRLEEELQMLKYQRHPDLWLKERFREDPRSIKWSDFSKKYEEHIWDGSKDPLFSAWSNVAGRKWTALESATGTGKTYWLARVMLWFLDVYDNPLIVTSAPKKDQLSLHLWSEVSRVFDKFKAIRPNAELFSLRLLKDTKHPKYFDSAEAVGFVAGAGSVEQSASKAQGFHRQNMLIVTEETPGMRPAVMKAFVNTSTGGTNNIILAVGNPDNTTDELHKFADKKRVTMYRVSGYDHPNIVLQRDMIPGAVSQASIDDRKDEYGEESDFFKSRVRGISPKQSTNSLIWADWLDLAWAQGENFGQYEQDESYNAMGIDVANSEAGDMACVATGENNRLFNLHEFQCPNANHIAYNILFDDWELQDRNFTIYNTLKAKNYDIMADCIGVDAIGVGIGTINAFKDEGFTVTALQGGADQEMIPADAQGKPMYTFRSLRAQMYWQARQDLQAGRVILDIPKQVFIQLKRELVAHSYTTKGGSIIVEEKEKVKQKLGNKSPNVADAFVYWNWMRQVGLRQVGAMPFR
jgi:hypothetical protein